MNIKFTPRKLPEYKVQMKEIVKVLNDKPHLLVRVEVSGEYFPHRDAPAFIRLKVRDEEYLNDLFTEVSPDNQKLSGYFPVNLPARGIIEFGYGTEIWGSITAEFGTESLTRLDRQRLPKGLVIVNDESAIKRQN
jgi:hypothetical protein